MGKKLSIRLIVLSAAPSEACTVSAQVGKKSSVPKFKCVSGMKFGRWSKDGVSTKKNDIRITRCDACNKWVWNFNLANHYVKEHPAVEATPSMKEIQEQMTSEFAKKELKEHRERKTYTRDSKGKKKNPKKPKKRKATKKSEDDLSFLVRKPKKKKRKLNKSTPSDEEFTLSKTGGGAVKRKRDPSLRIKRQRKKHKAQSMMYSEMDSSDSEGSLGTRLGVEKKTTARKLQQKKKKDDSDDSWKLSD